MTQEELDAAVEKLIAQSNERSADKMKAYEANVAKAAGKALKNRTARSTIFERTFSELKEAHERELKKIQEDLDESLAALYLENESGGGGSGSTEAPYEVDYSLPMRERYVTVKNYYLSYDDAAKAYSDCSQDEIAQEYLGSYYEYLMQLLRMSQ